MSARAKVWTNVFIVLVLAIQVSLALRGLTSSKIESRGEFSWNMFVHQFTCEPRYLLIAGDGVARPLNPWRYFRLPRAFALVWNLERLPSFHAFLCERHRGEAIRASVRCKLNDGAEIELVEPVGDVCSAENYGVHVAIEGDR